MSHLSEKMGKIINQISA